MTQRFFFVHLLKTAGTSLFVRFQRHFGEDGVYPNPSDGDAVVVAPQLVPARLVERWAERGDEIRMVAGHLPFCTQALLDTPFTTLTVLRDPVDRTLSYLRHHRQRTPEDADRPLEDIYEQQPRFDWLIHDHMVKMLGMSVEEMTDGMLTSLATGPSHLRVALDRLEHEIDLFGLTEHLDTFWQELQDRYGFRLGTNVVTNDTAPTRAPDALRRRIADDNRLDVELYERTVELFHRQRR